MSKNQEEGPRSFARFIEQAFDGDANAELSEKLHTLAKTLEEEASRTTTAKGTLKLELGLKIDARGTVVLTYDVTTKEPKPSRGSGAAWLSKGGNLIFENPRQQKLPLVDVSLTRIPTADDFEAAQAQKEKAL